MTCGCGQKKRAKVTGKRVVLPVLSTRAAMCSVCPDLDGEWCGVVRRRAVEVVGADACPRGRFPDKAGKVRWMGVRWRGVPWPIRVWLHATDRITHPESLEECGCIDRLKAWTERLAAARAAKA